MSTGPRSQPGRAPHAKVGTTSFACCFVSATKLTTIVLDYNTIIYIHIELLYKFILTFI